MTKTSIRKPKTKKQEDRKKMLPIKERLSMAEDFLRGLGKFVSRSPRGILAKALDREDQHPSLSIFVGYQGHLVVKDHATGKSMRWSKYLDLHGHPEQAKRFRQAEGWLEKKEQEGQEGQEVEARELTVSELGELRRREAMGTPVQVPDNLDFRRQEMKRFVANAVYAKDKTTLAYMNERLPHVKRTHLGRLGVGVDEWGNICIPAILLHGPVEDPRPMLTNIKVRYKEAGPNGERYKYLYAGGAAPYLVGNLKNPKVVFITEGELNAVAMAAAALEAGELEQNLYIGVGGASNRLPLQYREYFLRYAQKGAVFYLRGDADDAGKKWVSLIRDQLVAWGIPLKQIHSAAFDPLGRDIADWAARMYRGGAKDEALYEALIDRCWNVVERRQRTSSAKAIAAAGARVGQWRLVGAGRGSWRGSNRRAIIETGHSNPSRMEDKLKPMWGHSLGLLRKVLLLKRWGINIHTLSEEEKLALERFLEQVVDKTPELALLLKAYQAAHHGLPDRSIVNYASHYKLIPRFKGIISFHRNGRVTVHVTEAQLVAMMGDILEPILREIAEKGLFPQEREALRELFEKARAGEKPLIKPPDGKERSQLWYLLVELLRDIVRVKHERKRWQEYRARLERRAA